MSVLDVAALGIGSSPALMAVDVAGAEAGARVNCTTHTQTNTMFDTIPVFVN